MKNFKSPYMSVIGWGMFLTGAFMFASCADDDIIESTAVTTGDAICFSASKTRSLWEPDQTRSASSKEKQTLHCVAADGDFSVDVTVEDGIRSYESSQQLHSRGNQISEVGGWSYKVGAYYFFDESVQDESGTSIDFFSENSSGGLKINTDNNKNNAAVTTSYYWPPVGEMKFFAVAPADVAEATGATFKIPALANVNTPTLTYTIPSNVAEQKDIMVAQSTVACKTNNTAVDLQFEHLLAAVQFKVGKMNACQINSITLSGIYAGEYSFTYSQDENGIWGWNAIKAVENTVSNSFLFDYVNVYTTIDSEMMSEGDELTGNSNGTMLLLPPQELSNALVTVKYDNLLDTEGEVSAKASLTGSWSAGKTYSYAFNISTDLNITIPSPEDQDAHYVIVPMKYNLSGISSKVTNPYVELSEFKNNSSTNTSATFKSELSYLQKQGYWCSSEIVIPVDKDGNEGTPSAPNASIAGSRVLNLDINGEKTFYMLLGENNGDTDREVTLSIKGTYNGKLVTIGSGKFKQLCPSWGESVNYGCERIEDTDKYPFGYMWNRTVTYHNNTSVIRVLYSDAIERMIGVTVSSGEHNEIGKTYTALNGFIEYTVDGGTIILWKYRFIKDIKLNYNALNQLGNAANSDDGQENTLGLYNFTSGVNVGDLETTLTEYTKNKFTILWNSYDILTMDEPTGSTESVSGNYAVAMAIKKNEFVSYRYDIEDNSGNKTSTYVPKLAGTLEWYLPSPTEASNIFDPIEKYYLTGTYWSSKSVEDGKHTHANIFTFDENGRYVSSSTNSRDQLHKVRAVRKQPQ